MPGKALAPPSTAAGDAPSASAVQSRRIDISATSAEVSRSRPEASGSGNSTPFFT